MKQEGFNDHMIDAQGFDVGTVNGKVTLTEAKPLVENTNGEFAHGDFHRNVMGMLLYHSGYSNQISCMLLTVLHVICSVQDILMKLH